MLQCGGPVTEENERNEPPRPFPAWSVRSQSRSVFAVQIRERETKLRQHSLIGTTTNIIVVVAVVVVILKLQELLLQLYEESQ